MRVVFNGNYGSKKYTILDFMNEGIHYIIYIFFKSNIEKVKGNTRILLLNLF